MGSSDKASKQANKAEAERKAGVEMTQRMIESIYSAPGRENDIRDVEGATGQYLQGDLDRQNTSAMRALKFALARDGQTMGSVDVDQNRTASENYLRGAVEVQRRANAAGNSLRQADQSSKLNLFSMAQAGLDIGTASRQAGEAMRNNIGIAKADALQSGLGDVFGNMGDIYKRSRDRAGTRDAQAAQGVSIFQPNSFYGGQLGGFGGGGTPGR